MNRQKLEHLIETLDFVRRYQAGQHESVIKELQVLQDRYRTMVGHYYHFRENAFYEHNSPVFPISKIASDYQRNSPQRVSPSNFPNEADVPSPQTETSNAMPPNEADNVLIPEGFHFKCKLCKLEIPSPREEPTLFDMNQDTE